MSIKAINVQGRATPQMWLGATTPPPPSPDVMKMTEEGDMVITEEGDMKIIE